MGAPEDEERSHDPAAKRFMTTRWSVLLAVRDGDNAQAREALSSLFETYWYPLYAYIRRKGYDDDSARDLVQGFLTRLLEKRDLAAVDRRRGRFRSFLMAACSNYLINQADHARAIKRGGGRPTISIDRLDAEGRYNAEPSHGVTAERLFERQWTITLLDRVLARLDAEMERAGKREQLAALRPALLGEAERTPYARVALDLNINEEAARAAVYRLRRRYRDLLREEVARTLDDDADVDAEIRDLFLALGG
jgi:RNA polymerase sigma-70 factor (ECF subfamily)